MGLPDVLYSDHGSDFTSARLERVCLDTHIRLIHSRVGVPQGRGKIERFFGTVTTELLPHLPGHIPHGTRGRPVAPPALTLEQLDGILERFIVEGYHARAHSETGQPPVERWLGNGWLPRLPAHPEDLDLLQAAQAAAARTPQSRRRATHRPATPSADCVYQVYRHGRCRDPCCDGRETRRPADTPTPVADLCDRLTRPAQ